MSYDDCMLITSISGIRGTIGGAVGENLTPIDIVEFISAYGTWIKKNHKNPKICIGRDGRVSGRMVIDIAVQTLIGLGIDVINLDYATTPTVEMSVIEHNASGGIIITASHNPKPYNGIKMLNNLGEFLSSDDGQEILNIKESSEYDYADIDNLGSVTVSYNHTKNHIQKILDLDLVDADLVRNQKYKIVVDAINSVGGIAVPMLLEKMGVEVVGLYCECNGDFQHIPEPLEKNLSELKSLVIKTNSDLGIAIDPDVDRLVFVDEGGKLINEEYTIVSIADYVLENTPGSVVSNLSSSRALSDLAKKYNQKYTASAVGEKNVVEKMKETNAVVGGEGSGGVIYPELHYGRDALVGIALLLTSIAKKGTRLSELRKSYPDYFMSKEKVELQSHDLVDKILTKLKDQYSTESLNEIDGLKIDFVDSWVHIRASNTEPLLRIYTEARTVQQAENLAQNFLVSIKEIIKV